MLKVGSEGARLQKTVLSACDDATLFVLMAEQGDAAQAAWEEFYRRHVRYVYGFCVKSFNNLLNAGELEDLVHDVFVRAYQKAHTFSFNPGLTSLRQQRCVRGWFGKIATNLVRDRFRNQPMIEFPGDDFLDLCETEINAEIGFEHDSVAQIREALKTLSDREQDILRTTAFWYQPGARQQRLPHTVLDALAKRCGTSPANIRQLRSRAAAKVREFIGERAASEGKR